MLTGAPTGPGGPCSPGGPYIHVHDKYYKIKMLSMQLTGSPAGPGAPPPVPAFSPCLKTTILINFYYFQQLLQLTFPVHPKHSP